MARGKLQGFVEKGGNTINTDGRVSTTQVQRSFPLATVTVFNGGTANISTIFSDEAGTPKSNPFIADADGFWFFWVDQGRYDIQFSGGGLSAPFTLFGLETIITTTALNDPGANGVVVRTASGVTTARTITGTTSAIVVTNGNGVSGNPVINLDTNLAFAGKTIDGGTFTSPGISSFQNAIHNHQDAAGGGQLNASNVFSTGTIPVVRLPLMVGATSVLAGVAGLVTQPNAGDQDKFLRGDGTWQVTGGGGGTPGSPSLSLQYNNAGAFAGVTGTSSDGTQVTWTAGVLRATSPRITTNILDTNGNVMLTLNALGSAVNNLQIANAASGGHPVISAVGAGADINIVLTPKGAGIIDTAGNFKISNNAPQITLVDVNDSKTVRISVNGANWDFTNDTLGSVPLRIDTTTNLITTVGNVLISKASPSLKFVNTSLSHEIEFLLSGGTFRLNNNTGSFEIFNASISTSVVTFNAIPVGPASNPTTANQLARKQYTDDQRVRWSVSWFYAFLPSAVESTESVPRFIVPDGQNINIEDITVVWAAGSDSSASNVFTIKRRNSAGTPQTDVGTIDVNTPAQNALQVNNIADLPLTFGDQIYPLFTTRNTASEQNVTVTIRGYQNSKTT